MSISTPVECYAQDLATQLGSTTFSPTSTIPVGTAILMLGSVAGKTITSVIDSGGNTWHVDVAVSTGSIANSIASANIVNQIGTGGTITIVYSNASSSFSQIRVASVTGLAAVGWFDRHGSANGAAQPLTMGSTGVLTNPNELIIATYKYAIAFTTFTPDPGFSNLGGLLESETGCFYQIVSATTALNVKGTSDAGTTPWGGVYATYSDTKINRTDVVQQGVTFSTWGGTIT